MINEYVPLCIFCQLKNKLKPKGFEGKAMLSIGFNKQNKVVKFIYYLISQK